MSNEGVHVVWISYHQEDVDVGCLNYQVTYFDGIERLCPSETALDYRLAERVGEEEKSLLKAKGAE